MNKPKTSQTFNIKELFDGNYFYIPDYQRGYSWEDKQLNDLKLDIINISKLEHSHYTGTIVAAKNLLNNKYELVDGQQRITTIIILLNEIYQTNKLVYSEINSTYLLRGDIGEEKHVLTPNEETQDCFYEVIINNNENFNSTIKSHEAIINAKLFFKKWIKELLPDQINEIYLTISEKLNFLFFCPTITKEIGIMFEVINNRGKELSELEKIKNYFIYYATVHNKGQLHKDIDTNWFKIQYNLSHAGMTSNDNENIFLRNCYIVFFDSKKKKSWEVYKQCKIKFDVNDTDNVENSVQTMRNFVKFLANAAEHYAWFYNNKYFQISCKNDKIKEIGKCITYLRCQPTNASIMPLYIAVMSRLDKIDRVIELLTLIEIVNMRLYILHGILSRTDSKQGDLFWFAKNFYNNPNWIAESEEGIFYEQNELFIKGDIFDWLSAHLIQITLNNCKQEDILTSLTLKDNDEFDFYNWKGGIRYFLACYEEEITQNRAKRTFDIQRILTGKKAAGDNFNDQLSVEHIWARANRENDYNEYPQPKRRLGNFVLCGLSSNITLSKNDITEKIKILNDNNSAGEGALDMLQVAELQKMLKDVTTQLNSMQRRQTKNYWRDLAIGICDSRERILINFALKRWLLPKEKKLSKQILQN